MADRLACVQQLAATNFFSEDTLLSYLIPTDSFIRDIQKDVNEQWLALKSSGDRFMPFYRDFRTSLPSLIRQTLGATLFASPNTKPVEHWTPEDARNLLIFAQSRYRLLNNVIQDIGDKTKNPLSDNIPVAQMEPLIYETLRSALYPQYRLQIRVGYGGIKEDGVLLRAPSYIMNALDIIRIFENANRTVDAGLGLNTPDLCVISADQLTAEVNAIDAGTAHRNGQSLLDILGRFVQNVYPDLVGKVVFSQPSRDTIYQRDIYTLIEQAASEVVARPARLSSTEQQALKALVDFAVKHSAQSIDDGEIYRRRMLNYLSGHLMPAVFATVVPHNDITGPVWKIGARSEQHFDVFQRTIRGKLYDAPTSDGVIGFPNAIGASLSGLFTTTIIGGNPPPYYRDAASAVDVFIRDFVGAVAGDQTDAGLSAGILWEDTGAAADLRAMLRHPSMGRGNIAEGLVAARRQLATLNA